MQDTGLPSPEIHPSPLSLNELSSIIPIFQIRDTEVQGGKMTYSRLPRKPLTELKTQVS